MDKVIVHYPQDEMTTFLLPVTRGCSYNQCSFCSMYKDQSYSEVPLSEIEIILMSGYEYTEKVFLTGADPLSIGFDRMHRLLQLIKKHLPYCARVASYASISNIAKYTEEELVVLHNEGLRMLYIGFETGSEDVLKRIKKPHTAASAITQAQKLNRAHLPFNSIIMIGIAGQGLGIQNSISTAKMINHFHTDRVITMKLTVFHGCQLAGEVEKGEFTPAGKEELLLELETLLEYLEPKKPMIFDTTHPTNILKIKGTLPRDKSRLINLINLQK